MRLATHVRPDGLIAAQSVGQVVSAIRAEASALGLDARFVRVTVAADPPHASPGRFRIWRSYSGGAYFRRCIADLYRSGIRRKALAARRLPRAGARRLRHSG